MTVVTISLIPLTIIPGRQTSQSHSTSFPPGDSLNYHEGSEFSTRDNGPDPGCATNGKDSGWWFNGCHTANLNGYYYTSNPTPDDGGISWIDRRWYEYSYKFAQMKVAPS